MQLALDIWPPVLTFQPPSFTFYGPGFATQVAHILIVETYIPQECIPVGCVPSAAVAVSPGGRGSACKNITFATSLRTVKIYIRDTIYEPNVFTGVGGPPNFLDHAKATEYSSLVVKHIGNHLKVQFTIWSKPYDQPTDHSQLCVKTSMNIISNFKINVFTIQEVSTHSWGLSERLSSGLLLDCNLYPT